MDDKTKRVAKFLKANKAGWNEISYRTGLSRPTFYNVISGRNKPNRLTIYVLTEYMDGRPIFKGKKGEPIPLPEGK